MNKVLSAQHITKSYGKKQVLHDVSLEIEPGVIYGLIGRNGAGKTTLLSILTAQNTWDAGTVTYGGEPVWENARALADICFSRELSPMMMFGENTYKVRDYLKAAATYYPHWDEAYAQKLVQRFGLETKKRISKLSKGMLSMVTIVLALASRAPVTILDEPVAGLDVVALTDHNTAGNCAPFLAAAARRGLTALPGMELCTREEIHVVCLFPTPYHGEEFEAYVSRRLPPLSNHPAVFGHQIYMDAGDLVLGEDPRFLAGHTDIGLEEVSRLAAAFGGAAFPAHIDRPSFSLLGVLGLWMPELGFPLAEVSRQCPPEFRLRPDLAGLRLIANSDAHYLDQVWEAEHAMELPERTAAAVLYWLQGTR